jgi:hypothetical protein
MCHLKIKKKKMIRCGMAVKRIGMLGVGVRKMETVTVTGKGR